MYFALISSAHNTITSSEEALKVCEHSFFLEIKAKGSVRVAHKNVPIFLWQ